MRAKKDAKEDADARSLIPGQWFPKRVRSSAVVNVMICEIVSKHVKTIFEYFLRFNQVLIAIFSQMSNFCPF